MKVLRICALSVLVVGALELPGAYKYLTHSCRISRCKSSLPFQEAWKVSVAPLESVRGVLAQKFYYLGKGNQAYVFSSADNRYVLKLLFFNQWHPKLFNRLFGIPPKKSIEYRRQMALNTLEAYRIAAEHDSSLTEIAYAHLNLTENMLPEVDLHGPAGRRWRVPLDRYRFVLQRKAIPLEQALFEARGDPDLFSARIASCFELIRKRLSLGICNTDSSFMQNLGFLDERVIELDFGRYTMDPSSCSKEGQEGEWRAFMKSLTRWVERSIPERSELIKSGRNSIDGQESACADTCPQGMGKRIKSRSAGE